MAEETKTDKDAAKLRRSFKIACGLIAAYFIVPPALLETADYLKTKTRLDRYQEGRFYTHLPTGYKKGEADQCILANSRTKLVYEFHKTPRNHALPYSISPKEQVIKMGTLPATITIPLPCDELKTFADEPKWDSFDDFIEAHRSNVNTISENLKDIANQPDTGRQSRLYQIQVSKQPAP